MTHEYIYIHIYVNSHNVSNSQSDENLLCFLGYFFISNRNILKNVKRNPGIHEVYKKNVYLEGEKKNKNIIKTKHQRS